MKNSCTAFDDPQPIVAGGRSSSYSKPIAWMSCWNCSSAPGCCCGWSSRGGNGAGGLSGSFALCALCSACRFSSVRNCSGHGWRAARCSSRLSRPVGWSLWSFRWPSSWIRVRGSLSWPDSPSEVVNMPSQRSCSFWTSVQSSLSFSKCCHCLSGTYLAARLLWRPSRIFRFE